MRARVFDKSDSTFYVSEVYGIINSGGDHYIVGKQEADKWQFHLVDYLDFSSSQVPHPVQVECIDCNNLNCQAEWLCKTKEDLEEFNQILEQQFSLPRILRYSGYRFIWEDRETLIQLLLNKTARDDAGIAAGIQTKLTGWNYIESKSDIDMLMEAFAGFHDSVIKEIHYVSGDYVDGEGMHLTFSCDKKIQFLFDSDWSGSMEVIFEAVRLMQLVPPAENYLADLFDASVFVKHHEVYFYDSSLAEIPETYSGTWVKALGMRWRTLK
ncbi:hypothetical protein [uncultured Clostridium sp.]|uniref:hypothetical protein n=1 Tax=uncultured Clostridium sp. TaxID=59620 RepID=UPI0025DBDFF3|nr:hypothetical protein [uncultured Clostridium sp.]